MGIVITGLELGFIFAYNAGWKVSTLSTVSNAFLVVSLILVGFVVYQEPIDVNKIIGILICFVGLWFINK